MNEKIVVKINSKTCILTIVLAIAFSTVMAFSMYKLIEMFYSTGCAECVVAKFIFVAYPIIFLVVAFTLSGYLMIVGEVEDDKGKKKLLKRKKKSK
ncbi:MAG: hypothetical protein IKQ35_04520 [Bacilli bacterium]|nr:hypothetical protein [Bacilli bacterium]